jgi:dual specificity MAP kinase phosphatase
VTHLPCTQLGNTQDVPVPKAHQRSLGADPTVANMDDGNPCSFSICIESHDQASLLSRDILDSATQVLDQLELQGGRVCEEVQPMLTADNELIETTKTLLRPNIDEVVHLETVSTAAALGTSTRAQDAFVAQVVDLAVWIRDQSAPNPLLGLHDSTASHPHAPRRVLLHCGDGYTETSLLALAYVMLSRRCAVSEAYLFLQIDCERSFFVYTADRETVLKLEQRVIEVLEREDEEERYTRRWLAEQRAVATFGVQTASALRRSSPAQDLASANNHDHLSSTSQQQQDQEEEDLTLTLGLSSSSMGRSDSGYVDSTEIVVDPLLDDDKTRCALEEEAARVEAEIEVACGGPKRRMRSADPVEDAWFFGPTFEGHFPSRILPHLVSLDFAFRFRSKKVIETDDKTCSTSATSTMPRTR